MHTGNSGKSGLWVAISFGALIALGAIKLSSSSNSKFRYSPPPGQNSYFPYGETSARPQRGYRDVWVQPHRRSNGTYVPGHYRSYPDGNVRNNWSQYPNVNPYTGARGTRR